MSKPPLVGKSFESVYPVTSTSQPQKIDPKVLGKLDPASATVREIQKLAQRERGKNKASKPRGRTTTAEERALATKLQASLRKAGAAGAEVVALATKPGAPAKLRIELPIDELAELKAALASVHRRR